MLYPGSHQENVFTGESRGQNYQRRVKDALKGVRKKHSKKHKQKSQAVSEFMTCKSKAKINWES